ncbi:ArsR/SmtB family transcription factor [Actinomycetospora soli]|uniref:ArsR/SmtB family transcription factor n=1 Tax=Actinomycetospora soli TaxID=2893887 RepID=UPI001E2AE436|nr:metalloregulator ArsR/SmtB family transcription factor [Actinomycetospora soli]MCD2191604.1 metalloregulator ArsR/SmtB family transcription factor [Actinomycetospora soli]
MSKQEQDTLEGLAAQLGCYSPLVREPLSGLQAGELSRLFKAMGDPVRLRLLSLIASHAGGEACVCDLTEVFDLSGPTISHHLKVLREAGLITGERRATWVYYRIEPDVLEALAAVLVPAAPDTVPDGLATTGPEARRELPVVEA